jgi:hypothetical protein
VDIIEGIQEPAWRGLGGQIWDNLSINTNKTVMDEDPLNKNPWGPTEAKGREA